MLKAENLPLSSADAKESGSLNLPESSGPHWPVMGILYLYLAKGLVVDTGLQRDRRLKVIST
jgi:hypothetical protein